MEDIIKYYSRKDIQEEIIKLAKNREISVMYGKDKFGKRPDVIEYINDILELVKNGATSFHASEERWQNPLLLKPGMTKKQLDDLRIGFDCILDIDSKYIDFSRIAAKLIVDALKFHDLKNFSVKFSVTGDTPVLIKENNVTRLISIKEAIELFKGGKKLRILSLNKRNLLIFSKVYNYLTHKDKIYNIYHRQSTLPLKVTGHHSVFSWENGNIIQKKVSELKIGDWLVTYNSFKNKPNKIDVITYNYNFNKKPVSKKVKITKQLMRLTGYFLADGHITRSINQIGFSFNVNEIKYSDDCRRLLKNLTKRYISERNPNKGSLQIMIHSKQWYSFFNTFCGKGAKNKHIPSFIWGLPKEYFLELLRGYIRGDGYKRSRNTLVIKSVSNNLLIELTWLCKMHNISCNLSTEYIKPHKLPQGNMFKGSFVHILSFPKNEFPIKEFSKKRRKCDTKPFDKVFPTDGLKLVYKQIKPKKFLKHRNEQMTIKKRSASLDRIKKVIKWFENYKSIDFNNNSLKIINNYKRLSYNDISVLMIKKIEEGKTEKVYDVSVENTESFFGNYYPILLHNSGGSGFHIGIPFETFPKEINNQKINLFFPDGTRIIANYIKNIIEDYLSEEILNLSSLQEISKALNKPQKEIVKNKKFDPFSVVDIDSVLISSRHMFRMPYSINEKTNLASIPINPDEIKDFKLSKAKLKNIKTDITFLDTSKIKYSESTHLLQQAIAFDTETNKKITKKPNQSPLTILHKHVITKDFFPPCILKILKGIKQDGRKRAIFILTNFLKQMGWDIEKIQNLLLEWNKKNYEPLREGYILSQVNWHKKQHQTILPPNCDNEMYYRAMVICNPDNWCKKSKNPVNYTNRKLLVLKENQPKKSKKKTI